MNRRQRVLKRTFDVTGALSGLIVLGWVIVLLAVLCRRSTGGSGIFRQIRVGRGGVHFAIRKLRTMRVSASVTTTVTTADDPRITTLGRFLRKTKLDELPQLINVLRGDMSFVGPRPDVPEFVQLGGAQARAILSVLPGITGPATLVFRDEERLLSAQPDPESFNLTTLLPTKARINEHYVRTWHLRSDIRYIWMTISGATLTLEEALR